MRPAIALLCGTFLAATLAGCSGGASIPTPPENAKAGPPPGSSDAMYKPKAKDKAKK